MDILAAIEDLPWLAQAVIRLAVATALGGLIGFEREHHGRSAGFRTQMLVALGAAMAVLVGLHMMRAYGSGATTSFVRIDPSRIAYGVMGGIGFLGAGAIISHGVGVRGLTTAASLWCTAAIGLAAGSGMYVLAVLATLIVLFVLYVLSWLDRLIPSRWYKTVRLVVPAGQENRLAELRERLRSARIRVVDWSVGRDSQAGEDTIVLHVSSVRADPADMLRLFDDLDGLRFMSVE